MFCFSKILCLLASAADLPSHWTPPLDTLNEFVVTPASKEYTDVETKFLQTLGAAGTGVIEVYLPLIYTGYFNVKQI